MPFIISSLYRCFYSMNFYRQMVASKKGIGLRYLFATSVLLTFYILVSSFIDEMLDPHSAEKNKQYVSSISRTLEALPDLTFRFGTVVAPQSIHMSIPAADDSGKSIIIDSAYTASNDNEIFAYMTAKNAVVLLTSSHLYIYDDEKEAKDVVSMPYPLYLHGDFTRQDILHHNEMIKQEDVGYEMAFIALMGLYFLYEMLAMNLMLWVVVMVISQLYCLFSSSHAISEISLAARARLVTAALMPPMIVGAVLIQFFDFTLIAMIGGYMGYFVFARDAIGDYQLSEGQGVCRKTI